MKRLFAVMLIVASAFGLNAASSASAKAGVYVGIGIGYGYPVYRPRYYYPRGVYRRRYLRPRVYRRYYRPRRVYRHRRTYRRGLSRAHYRDCARRYRSYRASDNTFQPYRGGRRQCRSRF